MIYLLIFIVFIIFLILIYNKYNKYLNDKYYNEGIEIINKLNQKKEKDKTFDSVKKYYINLERSKDRLKNIENEFKIYGIENYERIEAFDGKALKSTRKGKFKDLEFENTKDKKCSKTHLAVTCSHLKAIKKSYDDGEKMAIIMEDDMNFILMPYWEKSMGEILESAPDDLEVLQLVSTKHPLGRTFLLQKDLSKKIRKQKIIKRRNNTWSAGCYLILRKGIEKIMERYYKEGKIFLNQKNIVYDMDIIFSYLNCYYLEQNLFLIDSFNLNSTIDNYTGMFVYETLQTLKFYDKNSKLPLSEE